MPFEGQRSPSPEPRICRWGFACTRSFCSRPELMQHVIVDHIRIATPVSRDSIPQLLRTVDGIGESYNTENFLSPPPHSAQGEPSNPVQEESKHNSQDSNNSGPAASLPSPPISAFNGHDDDERHTRSSSPGRSPSPNPHFYVADPDMEDQDDHLRSILLSDAIGSFSPRFASLDSPSSSIRPGSLPSSPTFSDVITSTQQAGKPASQSQLLVFTASRDSNSSSDSHAMVVEQLTPVNDDSDDDEDEDGLHRQGVATAASATGGDEEGEEEEEEDLYANEINWDAKMTQNPSQLPATQTESQSSTPARNYGSIVKRRPTSQPPGAQNSSSPATSRPPSFEVQNTPRRQAWYAPRRKRSRGEGLSPSSSPALSPALSPMETAFGLGPLHKSKFPSSRLNEDPSQSSLHRKRYKLDSSVDSESQAQPQRRIRRSGLPVSRDLERDDECEADVSQMQVETQLTMSSPPPRIQRRYSHYPSKSNNPLEYALQSQAPYDSQE